MKNFKMGRREERWCVRETERHEGLAGCRRAQERDEMRGVAGDVMGDMGARDGGSGEE